MWPEIYVFLYQLTVTLNHGYVMFYCAAELYQVTQWSKGEATQDGKGLTRDPHQSRAIVYLQIEYYLKGHKLIDGCCPSANKSSADQLLSLHLFNVT